MDGHSCLEHLLLNRVYIIIVNWNGWRDTIECLESLQRITYSGCSVVLCDNGSDNESVAHFRNWANQKGVTYAEYQREEAEAGGQADADPWLVLIRNGENLGFAGGNNVGLRYALARNDLSYAWLLNNDTVVEPEALSHMVKRMELLPSAGMCGSTICYYHEPQRIQALGGGYYCRWIGLPWHYGRFTNQGKPRNSSKAEAWMNYVEGASMLVSKQFLKEIGLMCEDYFLYFEEADWAVRAKDKFRLLYSSESVVYHKVGGSIGTRSNPAKKSYTCDYFNIRNRIVFTLRYFPLALPSIYLVILGELLLRLVLGKWDRVVMILRLLFDYTGIQRDSVAEYRMRP